MQGRDVYPCRGRAELWANGGIAVTVTFFSSSPGVDPVVVVEVFGKPEPQGSVRAFVPTYRTGEPMRRAGGSIVVNLTSTNPKLKVWRKLAQREIGEAMAYQGVERLGEDVAVRVDATFFLARPKAHHGTGRNAGVVKASAPAFPVGRGVGDVDKYLRALLDALTGTVLGDDAQVVDARARKVYCGPFEEPRVEFSVFALAP